MPPKRLSHRVIFKGRIIRVERDQVLLFNGRKAHIEIVRHRGSVVLIPQPAPDRVILIRQYRYVIGRWIWELPAGSVEEGETTAACARRECEEEIGLTPRKVERLAKFYPTPGFCDELMTFYRCSRLTAPKGPVRRDIDEQIEPRDFTLAEARKLLDGGHIVDMKTVIGIGLVESPRVDPFPGF